MQIKNTFERFGLVSKTFHWLVFVLITVQLYLIWMFETLTKTNPTRGTYMFLHKSVGATILLVAILWIIWRRFNVLPVAMPQQRSWQNHLAKFTHTSMLIAIVLLPISGLLMSMAAGRGLDWFGLFTIAPFGFIPQSETLAGQFNSAHEIIATILICLVVLHVIGALVHHFIYKDNVLRRMWP